MSYHGRHSSAEGGFLAFLAVFIGIIPFIAHIVACVKADWATMLILGLICFPVGWVHGVGVIFGWWG